MAKLDVSNRHPLGLFASAWAGVPYVPLNYRLTNEEIEALLKRVTPAYLVTSSDRVDAFGALDDVHAVATDSFSMRSRTNHPSTANGVWIRKRWRYCSLPAAQPANPRPLFFGTSIWLATY